jgi:phage shock protein C
VRGGAAEDGIPSRSRRLYRDPGRAKIGGVCAGIAGYYGIETWVVRCAAVTGLIFVPQFVFPAYWVAYFLMGLPPREPASDGNGRARDDHSSPAPELGSKLSPRRSLRNIQADLTQIELKLRRMETHVVSGQYELQKELNKIDEGGRG